MRRNQLWIQLLSLGFGLSCFGQGLVSLPKQRGELLVQVDAILEREPVDLSKLEIKRSLPFAAVAATPAPREVNPDRGEAAPTVVAPEPRLSDEAALRLAARSFQPAGSLITSTRRVLRLENGRMVNEGHVFGVNIRGERYRVTIDSVSEGGYILRVGEATLSRSFTEGDNRATRAGAAAQ